MSLPIHGGPWVFPLGLRFFTSPTGHAYAQRNGYRIAHFDPTAPYIRYVCYTRIGRNQDRAECEAVAHLCRQIDGDYLLYYSRHGCHLGIAGDERTESSSEEDSDDSDDEDYNLNPHFAFQPDGKITPTLVPQSLLMSRNRSNYNIYVVRMAHGGFVAVIEFKDEVLTSSKGYVIRLDGEFDNSCQLSVTLGEKPATPLDRLFIDAYLSVAEFSDGDSIEQNLSNDLPSDNSSAGGNRSATSFFDDVDDADYQFNLAVEQDWQYAIFISTMRGCSKLTPEGVEEVEVYSMRGGRMYLAVPSEQVTKRIANCELLRFKPDGKGMYMVKESTYRSGGVSGSLKVRQDRSVALKTIATCGFTGMSFEECMNQKKYIPLWCDLVGILRLEAIEAHRFNLRSIFTKNMFSALRVVRVSLECQHRSARSFDMMAAGWRVVNVESISHMETPTAGIPDCYWPAEAQRLDDITVDERLSDSCNLTLRSAHFPTRAIHAHVSQTTITPANRHMRMTALVVPVPGMRGVAKTEWHVQIAGPMQVVLNVTRDRLLNYSPRSYRDVIPPVDKDLVERVKLIDAALDRKVTILKPSPVFY